MPNTTIDNTATTQDSQTPAQDTTQNAQDTTQIPTFSAPEIPTDTNQERVNALNELKKQIQEALKEDNNLILNTHYTLLGIAELLELSREFFTFYGYQCENLKLNNKHYNTIKSEMVEISKFVNSTFLI